MVKQQYIVCYRCGDVCFGETIRAYGKYFHIYCFSCEVVGCAHDLLKDGFFVVGGGIYCRKDYHKLMGKKCAGCKKYVEGEVISALEHLYHPRCFRCITCADVFPPNAEICYDGNDFFCKTCKSGSPTYDTALPTYDITLPTYDTALSTLHSNTHTTSVDKEFSDTYLVPNPCVSCKHEIKSGQALIACDKQWHLWCFTCHACGCLLVGDYMAHDGQPYCENDYHANFGVLCDHCGGFITGKVLQAGEKCYHPKCSRCAMCGEIFDEGEEMFLQGSQIWHPKCNKDAQRVREKRDNKEERVILDDDSDGSSDSTIPPTENYDASRSYNESSDVVDIDDASHVPVMKTNTVMQYGFRGSDLFPTVSNVVQEERIPVLKSTAVNTPIQFTSNPDLFSKLYKGSETNIGDMLIDIDKKRQISQEDVRRDFYKYLMKTDHHHVNRMFQGSPTSPNDVRCVTSPSHNSPRSISSPGSFRSANSPNGLRSVNPPNGFRSVKSASNGSTSSPNGFRSADSPNGFRSASSPSGVKLCSTPPYHNDKDDTPPPIPPPPTRTSSRKWQQKYSSVSNSLRRPSFSKAISPATDESRSSTLTDSDTFASSVTASSGTDGLDESTEKITLKSKTSQLVQKKKERVGTQVFKCMTTYA